MNPEALARLIVKTYVDTFVELDRTAGRSVDFSAIHLGGR